MKIELIGGIKDGERMTIIDCLNVIIVPRYVNAKSCIIDKVEAKQLIPDVIRYEWDRKKEYTDEGFARFKCKG